jgi:hypothetical protein
MKTELDQLLVNQKGVSIEEYKGIRAVRSQLNNPYSTRSIKVIIKFND